MVNLPERITEPPLDQTTGVKSLKELFDAYLLPAHRYRSYSAPNPILIPTVATSNPDVEARVVANIVANVPHNQTDRQESLCHAFYRMIGFPIIASDGSFFNPGFEIIPSNVAADQLNIARKVSTSVRSLQTLREDSARRRADIFRIQATDASVYAVTLSFAESLNKFKIVDESQFSDSDPQTFSNPIRREIVERFYERGDGSEIETFFESGSHVLRPIAVNYSIEKGTKPATNRLCVPFLPLNKQRRLEGQKAYLDRPVIELILRLRLRQQKASEESESITSAIAAVFPEADQTTLQDVSVSDLKRVASALLNQENVSQEDVFVALDQASAYDIIKINEYVKGMKSVIDHLRNSLLTLKKVRKNIQWTPLPSTAGPAGAPAGKGTETEIGPLLRYKKNTALLDQQIRQTQTKASNADFAATISDNSDVSLDQFALGGTVNTQNRFTKELNELKEQRADWIRKGSQALRDVEIITGEVSGFGLIDALAVHTALWAVPVDILLGLLDERSFNRLYDFNGDLRSEAVEARKSGSTIPVITCITAVEEMVANILAFVDRLVDQKIGSPPNAEGGDIPRS